MKNMGKLIGKLIGVTRARNGLDELIKKLEDKDISSWKTTWRTPGGIINNLTIGTRVETETGYMDVNLHSYSIEFLPFDNNTNTYGSCIEFGDSIIEKVKIHSLYEGVSSCLGEPILRDRREGESKEAFGNRLATKGARTYDWKNP